MGFVIFTFLILIGVLMICHNRDAHKLFSYMAEHHRQIWVRLGSPSAAPGEYAGTWSPSWNFIFRGEYRRLNDPIISQYGKRLVIQAWLIAFCFCAALAALIAANFFGATG